MECASLVWLNVTPSHLSRQDQVQRHALQILSPGVTLKGLPVLPVQVTPHCRSTPQRCNPPTNPRTCHHASVRGMPTDRITHCPCLHPTSSNGHSPSALSRYGKGSQVNFYSNHITILSFFPHPTYSYIHTHIYTYSYIHTHIYILIYTHTHIYILIYTHTHIYTYSYIHTHIYILIYTHTHIYILIYTYSYIHINLAVGYHPGEREEKKILRRVIVLGRDRNCNLSTGNWLHKPLHYTVTHNHTHTHARTHARTMLNMVTERPTNLITHLAFLTAS